LPDTQKIFIYKILTFNGKTQLISEDLLFELTYKDKDFHLLNFKFQSEIKYPKAETQNNSFEFQASDTYVKTKLKVKDEHRADFIITIKYRWYETPAREQINNGREIFKLLSVHFLNILPGDNDNVCLKRRRDAY
jgi:hypothetical protein